MGYVDEVLEVVKKKNADQPEFLQAVTEVLDSLRPVSYTHLDYCKEAVQMDVPYALSNSLGFGGHNASILLKKYSE